MSSAPVRTDLEFACEPRDFFEAPTRITLPIGVALIDDGKETVTLTLPAKPVDRLLAKCAAAALHSVLPGPPDRTS